MVHTSLLFAFIYFGLYLPDLDLKLMGILHHRSIITHSLLIPLLLLFVKSNVTKPIVAGLCVGVSIHLAADLLSPMKGFSLIYLPAPIKSSIGAWQSFVWLGLNALVGLYLADRLTRFHKLIVPSAYVCASLWYAFYNEQNIFVLVPTAIVLLVCFRRVLINMPSKL